jgi:hypothetical protein
MNQVAKPESKQGKQIILLSVLGVAFVGAAIYNFAGALSQPAAAPPPPAEVQTASAPEEATPAASPVEIGKPDVTVPALPLSPVSNADPFKPAVSSPKPSSGGPVTSVAIKPLPRVAPEPKVKVVDVAPSAAPAPAPAAPEVKIAPPPPPRPTLAVTGIIDSQGGTDMALVTIGTESRILQLGDTLPGNYRVKRIAMDGVLLVSGTDRYFVALGNKVEGAAAPAPGSPS